MLSPPLLIVSFANETNTFSHNHHRSLMKQNYLPKHVHVIGEGVKWVDFVSTKIKHIHSHLLFLFESRSVATDTIIVVVDNYDTLCLAPPEELLDKYSSFCNFESKHYPIVFSAESYCAGNCLPLDRFWKRAQHTHKEALYKNLNAGFYMGRYDDIQLALSYVLASGHTDDQLAMCEFSEKFPDKIDLDVECKLMGTLNVCAFKDHQFHCRNGRVYNEATGEYPCFIHITGMHNDLLFRMDYFGRYVLGSEYKTVDYATRFKKIKDRVVVWGLVLLCVSLFFPPLLVIALIVIAYYTRGFGWF